MRSCFILLAVMLALDHVNKNGSVLANYDLELGVVVDGQCKADIVMKGFIDIITHEDYKKSFVGILGKSILNIKCPTEVMTFQRSSLALL